MVCLVTEILFKRNETYKDFYILVKCEKAKKTVLDSVKNK